MEQFMQLSNFFSKEEMENLKKAGEKMLTCSDYFHESWNGYNFTPGFSTNPAKYAYDEMEVMPSDVFVASFPKTGTNWTMEVVRQILYQDPVSDQFSKNIPVPMKLLEMDPIEKFEAYKKFPLKRRQFGTHLPADLINIEKLRKANAKVVYVLRNPKDQIVSFYNFAPKTPIGKNKFVKEMLDGGWDKYLEHILAGDFPMITKPGEWYLEHILSWYPYWDNKFVHFVYFEDMKKDLFKEIRRLADFLGVSMTEEKAKEISKACSFDEMKKSKANASEIETKFIALNMRKGGIGGWKEYFTVQQSEQVDKVVNQKLENTSIKFIYEL